MAAQLRDTTCFAVRPQHRCCDRLSICRKANERDGLAHDYTHKEGVEHSEIVPPEGVDAGWHATVAANSHGSSTKLKKPTAVDGAKIPCDELALLQAENWQLKLLLAEYLRQQNGQLAKMLKRFEID